MNKNSEFHTLLEAYKIKLLMRELHDNNYNVFNTAKSTGLSRVTIRKILGNKKEFMELIK